jgi:hypothetical protein
LWNPDRVVLVRRVVSVRSGLVVGSELLDVTRVNASLAASLVALTSCGWSASSRPLGTALDSAIEVAQSDLAALEDRWSDSAATVRKYEAVLRALQGTDLHAERYLTTTARPDPSPTPGLHQLIPSGLTHADIGI